MTISWKDEVEKRKDEFLEDLKTMLRVNSVRDDENATSDAPVGPGPKEALETFLSIAERDGFETKNVDNLAGRVSFGEGDETLGIIAHVDVVPVDEQWDTDPFEPVIKDGKIYARGASDDKGPGMAAYYALKMIKELDLPVSKKVHFIVGTDEESEWQGIDRYFETEPLPDFGFSPDAEFPIINGEKGLYTTALKFPVVDGPLKSFEGGQRDNMVPGTAQATIADVTLAEAEEKAEAFNGEEPAKISVEETAEGLKVISQGKVSHGAFPENGCNAATYLAAYLRQLSPELADDSFLRFVEERLHESTDGKKLGINHHDETMGDLSANPGVFKQSEDEITILLNCRVPAGISYDEIEEAIDQAGEAYHFTRETPEGNKPPHYVSPEDPLVKTLLDVYEEHTGEKGYEQVIGGGTYGRLLERGVAFGAQLPGAEDTMHQPNEYEPIDTLLLSMGIYADAIYRLIK